MKYLEFYSGIGGHRCAINELTSRSKSTGCCSCLHETAPTCVASFDVSTTANDTYHANFPNDKKTSQKPIETLSAKQLDAYNVDLWVLSPPCKSTNFKTRCQ